MSVSPACVSLQFDLNTDPAATVSLTLASSLGKSLVTNLLQNGLLRVIVFGLNQLSFAGSFATVLASVTAVGNIVGSDALGNDVGASITITSITTGGGTVSPGQYGYLTYAQAKTRLSQRLYDASKVRFPDAELGFYIKEALRTFNALANFQRGEFTFLARANVTWYDLTDAVNLPNTVRAMSVTDLDIINLIEYHLIEPQSIAYPLVWTGSQQFSVADILNAIQQRRDEVMSESGCTITQSLVAAASGRTALPDTVIDLRRVMWLPTVTTVYKPNLLLPADAWSAQSFEYGYTTASPGTPNAFLRSTQPPLSFDVDIQPAVAGDYDILTVDAGAALSATQSTILPVPDDWSWVIKWGALATLFSRDELAQDKLRAQYCLERFKQGCAALLKAPALLAAKIDGVPVTIDAVREADYYLANWQGRPTGSPEAMAHAGLNLLALIPIANADSTYTVTVNVVANMTLPVFDNDYLQVGRDDVEEILNYAQHIAMLKLGGEEFAATMPLYRQFTRHCVLYNSKLSAISEFRELLFGRSPLEASVNPRFATVDPANVDGGKGNA